MSSTVGRTAFRATRALRASGSAKGMTPGQAFHQPDSKKDVLQKGAKRDPELYILASIMTVALGGAGYYFASRPTSGTSESSVSMVKDSAPWQSGTSGKYQYHPGGDRTMAPKDAPSALHSVVIPNVNLPKHLHEQFNKYDKEEYEDY